MDIANLLILYVNNIIEIMVYVHNATKHTNYKMDNVYQII